MNQARREDHFFCEILFSLLVWACLVFPAWLLLLLLLLLLELELDPRRAARETEDARKLRKVKVEMEPWLSQRGSVSTSLYTTYFLPVEKVVLSLQASSINTTDWRLERGDVN